MLIRIEAKIPWMAWQDRHSGRWIAACEPLNLVLEGQTQAELSATISEGLQLLFHDLAESGDLSEFLRARGWRQAGQPYPEQSDVEFAVPWELLVQDEAPHGRTATGRQ